MIRFQTLSAEEAKRIITEYDNYDDTAFQDLVSHWSRFDVPTEYHSSYADFRKELIQAFQTAMTESGGKMNYLLDLRVGLRLYRLLSPGKDFSVIQSNDNGIWRYISVKVMPDITYLRYPDPEKGIRDEGGRLNHKRFYAATRRIWLKSLWWYVHLSWQGSEEATYEILKDNGTDNINKLIETPGRGYRVSLFRNMMLEYSKTAPHKVKDFAASTKLNNAKCVSVEPALTAGGEKEYAYRLFGELSMKGDTGNCVEGSNTK
ncbi:MAG: hypothetical protein RR413_06305 [Christensenellaceae bacterium]